MAYRKTIEKRIFPTEEQKSFFSLTFREVQFVYNEMIDVCESEAKHGEYYDYGDMAALLTKWRHIDYPFLRETDATALQQTLRILSDEYTDFYGKTGARPRKRENISSYKTACSGKNIRIENGFIRIPKAGMIKIEDAEDIEKEKICSIVIEKKGKERYFVTINIGYIAKEKTAKEKDNES